MLNPFTLLLTLAGSAALAFITRERLAWFLLGMDYSARSTAMRIAIYSCLIILFFFTLSIIQLLNRRIDGRGRLKPRAFLALCGGLSGALVFLFIFGPGTLDPGRVDWLMDLGDNAMHYLGWVFYRRDPWGWPLTHSPSLAHPYGISVSLTDPVTLLALPLKLLRSVLPEAFQYFGLWTLSCFILQGAFGALLVIETTKSRAAALLAPLFFCTAAILIYRVYTYIPHVGQWTILAALYLFFLNRRTAKYNGWWPALLCAGLLVQPYLLGILFILFLGAMAERLLLSKDRRGPAVSLAVSLACIALAMAATGMWGGDYSMSGPGVDYFKANLNALVNPVNSGWSAFLPPLPLAPETYPNVHYLGLGMILLSVFALAAFLVVQRGSLARVLSTNLVLILTALVLLVLSLGNEVTLNGSVLFTYTLPEPMMKAWSVFKATERFLWPATYLVFIFAIAQTVRFVRAPWLAAAVLALALVVQYADFAPIFNEKYAKYRDPQGSRTMLESQFWDDAGGQYRHLVMLPLNLRNWARLTEFAANHGMTTNYFYFGRDTAQISAGADEKLRALEAGRVGEGELFVLTDPAAVRAACGLVRAGTPFAYVDGEFVLAPGFKGDLAAYPEIAVTGANFDCEAESLAGFLQKHGNNLVVISVKEDASAVLTPADADALRASGFHTDLRMREGMSFIGIARDGRVVFERLSDRRIDFEAPAGEMVNGLEVPVDLRVSSAGRVSGEEISVIVAGEKDYAFNRPGLNACAFDPRSGKALACVLSEIGAE